MFPGVCPGQAGSLFFETAVPYDCKADKRCSQAGKTGAYPNKSEQKQIHDRSRDADCGKFTGSREAANDERIDGIVKLLQDIVI